MAYDVTLIECAGGGTQSPFGTSFHGVPAGFPSGPFPYLLYSQWTCGGINPSSHNAVSIGPHITSLTYSVLSFRVLNNPGHQLDLAAYNNWFFRDATVSPGSVPGQRTHYLISVDAPSQLIQVYINDQSQVVSGSWIGTNNHFLFGSDSPGTMEWLPDGKISSGLNPGIADIWCGVPPSFIDLSIAANRRKFIGADLSPVYLGTDGTAPFGFRPAIYCTVQSGGTPNDIATNLGNGPGLSINSTTTLLYQSPGVCTLPTPPVPPVTPPPGAAPGLRMDDILATDETIIPGSNQIFLEWSDDRGHSFGSPVGQPIGNRGEYINSLQWQRLGYARDRVFRISWSVPVATALQGAWIELDTRAKT